MVIISILTLQLEQRKYYETLGLVRIGEDDKLNSDIRGSQVVLIFSHCLFSSKCLLSEHRYVHEIRG